MGYKNLVYQAMPGRPNTVDSEAVLQALVASPSSCTQRVSGEFSISQSNVLRPIHDLNN